MRLLRDSLRDGRHALRLFRAAPGFAAAAVATLALGIGATSAIFSVVRTVLIEPLPYRDGDRIVTVWETTVGGTSRNVIAAANFVAWRERTHTLDHLGMVGPTTLTLVVNGQPVRNAGLLCSSDALQALGVQPALGRIYTVEEDSSRAVIVVSYQFWQTRLGGRRDVIDLNLTTDEGPRTVVGVMPPAFTVVGEKADFLVPYGQSTEQLRAERGRGSSYALARLRGGVSFEQAFAEMRGIFSQLEREEPQRNARRTVMMFHVQEQMVGDVRPALLALTGAVLLVLLVACVNVANLLLARSAARAREFGLRAALGARRSRLMRQMLIESLLLAAAGGAAGLVVAALCHRGLLALVADRIPVPRLEQLSFDWRVVTFTMLVALGTGIVFGVVPAWVSTSRLSDVIREDGRHGGGRRLHFALRALVVAEVALSLVLLAGAGLLMRSFVKLQQVDPGFRTDGVLTLAVQLPANRYDLSQSTAFYRESLSRMATLPGVQQAAGATCLPVPFACIGTSFWRVDRPRPADGQRPSGEVRPITPELFKTIGIPRIAGRDFSESDTVTSMPVAIVSEALARQQFGDENPLGRRLRVNVDHANGREDVEWTIVGVVGNTRSSLDGPVKQTIYIPRTQRPSNSLRFFIRGAQDPATLATTVTRLIRSLEPDAPIQSLTLDDAVGRTIARQRALSWLVGVFALAALALAAVGVYGVTAYSVRQRSQEIGVRIALGATAPSVLRLVLGQAVQLVVIGVAAGLAAAAALTRLLGRLLFEVGPFDPWTFGATALLLVFVGTVASYVPARRCIGLGPLDALRTN
jgi:putative ABC transport system permease protein